ncbi:Na+/H+ antiporter subunit E [Xinfangfangia sp. CPCC 101601]|uniref:Na+/H+ antiporter subunit E n=1 Tax=Pseudogemmobacter lacusdianii TaxID=3069608 RepID=A0ABU0VZW4_9RHOB|nr:Na+/H+ antiporter subunit E [Xinfangfangia sp. CPCC 101601]MDQ2067310.1 Na+/H+ antiporter subunit E [Xinfangfangia sp. CPCC 101601]
MSRILPHPLLTAALTLMWLLLTSFSLGHLLLGFAIATLAGRALALIEPQTPHIRSWRAILKLMRIVSIDIIRSNWAVAALIVTSGRHGKRVSAIVDIPLRLKDPVPLALLAMVITATPGTAWLDYDRETGVLLLHVFDVVDEDEWRALIRDRYEALLLEAFA